MSFHFPAFFSGLTIALGLLVAIGPQNTFVLKQGIARAQIVAIVTVCILCDILLITLGVAGLGAFISSQPMLIRIATWGGAAFLALYGFRSFRSAMKASSLQTGGSVQTARRGAILAAMAFTLLNPYVYLDTVVLMGAVSSRFSEALPSYWLGCVTTAVCWFGGLGFFAGRLAPLFARPFSWRVLDSMVGVIMCATAWHLLSSFG